MFCTVMSLLFRGAKKRYPDDATDHRSASTYLHLTYTRPLQLGLEVCICTTHAAREAMAQKWNPKEHHVYETGQNL